MDWLKKSDSPAMPTYVELTWPKFKYQYHLNIFALLTSLMTVNHLVSKRHSTLFKHMYSTGFYCDTFSYSSYRANMYA